MSAVRPRYPAPFMKKYLVTIILTVPVLVHACTAVVVAFKGLNDLFDHKAFAEYVATYPGYCGLSYSWHEHKLAQQTVDKLQVPYQLYGFSQGASTVHKILKQNLHKPPEYVITIGAYKTADVNFAKYGVPFDNYFDQSGTGQKSPGIFLNVPHMLMQSAVNQRRVGIVAVP